MRFLLCFSLFIACVSDAHAQAFQRRKAKPEEQPPNALLVMLPTGTRKIEALQRIGDSTRLLSLRYDVAEIQRKTVNDFRDNFSFCPVYFFYDTASSKVRRGLFAGNLLDTSLKTVDAAAYGGLTDEHLVAFFGYRARDMGAPRLREGMEYFEMADGDMEAMIQQLVLLDARMDQLVRPLPRTVANRYPGIKVRDKRPRYTYRHYAKYFDLQYKPSASRASTVLKNFYGAQNTSGAGGPTVAAPGDATPK